jgi:5,10-methenyltetrahydrofolate synthetase
MPIATRGSKIMRFEQIFDAKPRDIFYPEDYELVSEVKWYNLDLVLLPLVAIDTKGYRLGQGGGYYDTTFAKRERLPFLCGIGYEQQLIAQVPCEEWDLCLDYFASESQLLKFT